METLTTNGVTIEVESFYQKKHSNPLENRFIYSYRVTIRNENENAIQLLDRHWFIINANGNLREVAGEGVIGKQPILQSGEQHQYVSWSPLNTDLGKMHGYYTFQQLVTNEKFIVDIPEFKLIAPFKLS